MKENRENQEIKNEKIKHEYNTKEENISKEEVKKENKVMFIPIGDPLIITLEERRVSQQDRIPTYLKNSEIFKFIDVYRHKFTIYYIFKQKAMNIFLSSILSLIVTLLIPYCYIKPLGAISMFLISFFIIHPYITKNIIRKPAAIMLMDMSMKMFKYIITHPDQFTTWHDVDVIARHLFFWVHDFEKLHWGLKIIRWFPDKDKRIDDKYVTNLIQSVVKTYWDTVLGYFRAELGKEGYVNLFTKEAASSFEAEQKISEVYSALRHVRTQAPDRYETFKQRYNLPE